MKPLGYLKIIVQIFVFVVMSTWLSAAVAEVFQDFNDIPVTGSSEIPGSGGNWLYTSDVTNPDSNYPMTTVPVAGWRSTLSYSGTYDYFHMYLNAYNSTHMGFETYGYFEIDNEVAVVNRSLRIVVTGGKNNMTCGGATGSNCQGKNGLKLTTKEEYLNYLNIPIKGGLTVGSPYIYFANTSTINDPVPFNKSYGMNRLSLYVLMPGTLRNGNGGQGSPPLQTINVGPFSYMSKDLVFPGGDVNEKVTGHWYHRYYTQGGGWTHVIVDSHPQHNNSFSNMNDFPYPAKSFRTLGTEYFNEMFRFYITFKPYNGIGIPPYSVWFDEIEFINDMEPQNNETINSPSVTFLPKAKMFEIGFNDKYTDNGYSYATYEVRYSFSPITNVNWSSATPVHVQEDSRFGINASTDGKFKKWWPYYQAVWAPFKLASTVDEERLTMGTTVYFAIKDISQIDGDSQVPIANNAGRRYADFPDMFDYEGDKPALKYIKRIDYKIGKIDIPLSPTSLILPNSNN